MATERRNWFLSGLFLTTLATLVLEILDTRLLSVLTWYHLSFFAVSVAMFGMSAGAVRVYLGGARFEGAAAPRQLARYGLLLACAIPLSHVANLNIPIQVELGLVNAVALFSTTVVLAVPFYLSGVVVAIALTRIPGPSGLIYAADLIGAALGSLLVLALLRAFDVSSAALLCGAIAAAGALCFRRFAGSGLGWGPIALAVLLAAGAVANTQTLDGLRVGFSKGEKVDRSQVIHERWTVHGQVVAKQAFKGVPFYWGPGHGAWGYEVEHVGLTIDGAAGTVMTKWDGRRESLAWVGRDVTSLAYFIRQRGDACVIGVGGGRDILTALWAGSRSVTGIEINEALIYLLTGPLRDFAALADRPEVTLVHDEARSYLTRTRQRFDVLQMSLIDTWAATGAGAFTLSENGLYTLEGWKVFLRVLKPNGIFSVSRWYSPDKASETSRLLALATAALLDAGIEHPRRQMVLISGGGRVANLLVSMRPFTREELVVLRKVQLSRGFEILLFPDRESPVPLLQRIASSRSRAELDQVIAAEPYDYSPPTDERPYFFNIVPPSLFFSSESFGTGTGVIAHGNLLATQTLMLLCAITAVLVLLLILLPLVRAGLPRMARSDFLSGLAYFSLIGAGFMLIQIPLLQRFSVYLGHPTYSVAVTLFSMILATSVGSWLSDRIQVETNASATKIIPIAIAVLLLGGTFALQPVIDATLQLVLFWRCVITAAMVAAMALPLGFCFPLGLRLVRQLSEPSLPWMWGINGACGVMASVVAVAISLWSGIHTSLYIAALCYAAVALPAARLYASGRREQRGERGDDESQGGAASWIR